MNMKLYVDQQPFNLQFSEENKASKIQLKAKIKPNKTFKKERNLIETSTQKFKKDKKTKQTWVQKRKCKKRLQRKKERDDVI